MGKLGKVGGAKSFRVARATSTLEIEKAMKKAKTKIAGEDAITIWNQAQSVEELVEWLYIVMRWKGFSGGDEELLLMFYSCKWEVVY